MRKKVGSYDLIEAIHKNDLHKVQNLVEVGADVNVLLEMSNPVKPAQTSHLNALTYAIYRRNLPIVKYLTSLPQMKYDDALSSAAEIGFVSGIKYLLALPKMVITDDFALRIAVRKTKCNSDNFHQIIDILCSHPFFNPYSQENREKKNEKIDYLKRKGLQDHIDRLSLDSLWSKSKYIFFYPNTAFSMLPKEIKMEIFQKGIVIDKQEQKLCGMNP